MRFSSFQCSCLTNRELLTSMNEKVPASKLILLLNKPCWICEGGKLRDVEIRDFVMHVP